MRLVLSVYQSLSAYSNFGLSTNLTGFLSPLLKNKKISFLVLTLSSLEFFNICAIGDSVTETVM